MFKGLRVRMGVHVGTPKVVRDPMTRRVEYIGPVVNAAARITAMTHGGQVVMSQAVFAKLKAEATAAPTSPAANLIGAGAAPSASVVDNAQAAKKKKLVVGLGKFEMPDAPNGRFSHPLSSGGE